MIANIVGVCDYFGVLASSEPLWHKVGLASKLSEKQCNKPND